MTSQTQIEAHVQAESSSPSWSGLVQRVRDGDPTGMEELYGVFSKGIRFYLWRQLGSQDLDDKVHDIFLIITQSLQNGELREPDRLMGYVRTVVRRQVAAHIHSAVDARHKQTDLDTGVPLSDHRLDPERNAIASQNSELAMRILGCLPERDREILSRFYLKEQQAEQICREMGLTPTQFRLVKSRAKARYGQLGRNRLSSRASARQS